MSFMDFWRYLVGPLDDPLHQLTLRRAVVAPIVVPIAPPAEPRVDVEQFDCGRWVQRSVAYSMLHVRPGRQSRFL